VILISDLWRFELLFDRLEERLLLVRIDLWLGGRSSARMKDGSTGTSWNPALWASRGYYSGETLLSGLLVDTTVVKVVIHVVAWLAGWCSWTSSYYSLVEKRNNNYNTKWPLCALDYNCIDSRMTGLSQTKNGKCCLLFLEYFLRKHWHSVMVIGKNFHLFWEQEFTRC